MKLPISKIKPNPNNPRLIKDDKFKKLVQSLKDFPIMAKKLRKVVVDEDGMILGGNMRFKAIHLKAQETGKEVNICCAIGDETVDGKDYADIVAIAGEYIKELGGYEKLAEWGLV